MDEHVSPPGAARERDDHRTAKWREIMTRATSGAQADGDRPRAPTCERHPAQLVTRGFKAQRNSQGAQQPGDDNAEQDADRDRNRQRLSPSVPRRSRRRRPDWTTSSRRPRRRASSPSSRCRTTGAATATLIDSFKAKYGIAVNELNPDGGSGDEVEAIKANKDNKGPQAPDVIDVGLSFGPSAKAEGLLQPYKVSTWDTIPDAAKDADGYWTGDYYGVLSFAVNADLVKTPPADWSDLLKPEFKASVALAGDPRVSNQATMGVYAAGLAGGATDAAKAAEDGLNFFAELNKSGNFVPVDRQGGVDRAGRDAGPGVLGLQRARRARQPEGQSRRST